MLLRLCEVHSEGFAWPFSFFAREDCARFSKVAKQRFLVEQAAVSRKFLAALTNIDRYCGNDLRAQGTESVRALFSASKGSIAIFAVFAAVGEQRIAHVLKTRKTIIGEPIKSQKTENNVSK
jgi:hypothetical protein